MEKKRKWTGNWTGQKKAKQTLEVGMTGFLCTCNFKEKECIRDACRLLEAFSEDLSAGENAKPVNDSVAEGADSEEEDEDISEALNKEIAALSAEAKKPADKRKFQYVDTGVKNTIFIRSSLPDPLGLATKIIRHLDETKKARSRFLMRFIPIEVICRANMEDIKTKADELFNKYFVEEPKTFSIVFNRHYNNSIQRMDVITLLAELIANKNPGNKADLKNPETAVVVEIVKGFCLLCIAPDYFKYRKYNLSELCTVKDETEKSGDGPKSEVVEKSQVDDDGEPDAATPDVGKDVDSSS